MFNNLLQQPGPYDGFVEVNLRDIKAIADMATGLFNSALATPIKQMPAITQLQQQQALRVPQVNYQPQNNFPQIAAPQAATMSPPTNTQQTYFSGMNINTFGDAIDNVEYAVKPTIISWGKTRDIKSNYTISPIVWLYDNKGTAAIHFNVDANRVILKNEKKIEILTSLKALVEYFQTMFNMCKNNVAGVEILDSDIYVDIQNVKVSLGTLALVKYALSKNYWTPGSVANINGFKFEIQNGFVIVYKTGYTPISIQQAVFTNIVNSIPALDYFALNDDIFRQYQDDPKELTTRLIIELNKAIHPDGLRFSNIAILDGAAGLQIRNSLLGKEMKKSENAD